jgi:hypothetical protein
MDLRCARARLLLVGRCHGISDMIARECIKHHGAVLLVSNNTTRCGALILQPLTGLPIVSCVLPLPYQRYSFLVRLLSAVRGRNDP